MSTHLVTCIPWLAWGEAEDLYLPRDLLKQTSFEWKPAFSEYMFKNFRTWYINESPYKAVSRPGRNDLCHCGSGKKYKKCCRTKDDRPNLALCRWMMRKDTKHRFFSCNFYVAVQEDQDAGATGYFAVPVFPDPVDRDDFRLLYRRLGKVLTNWFNNVDI